MTTKSLHPLLSYLHDLHRQHAGVTDGEPASYIPELAKARREAFGIALVTTDGEVYAVGDADSPFTIQSISKAFVYATALADQGRDAVLRKVYVEPTGDAFNSISLHPVTGAPLNPMINAGAIATAGLVAGDSPRAQWERLHQSLSAFAGRWLAVDESVYHSESETGYRNRAIGWMLRNFGILETDPTPVVENYFRQCSLLVTCRDLGIMGATLANGGVNPVTGQRVMPEEMVGPTLSVMSTCGMYDYAGSWMFEVGLPAKSGVGGGIVAVLPGRFALATYSPPLDAKGNSVRGIGVCKALSRDLGLHMMVTARGAAQAIAREYSGAQAQSNRMRGGAEREALARRARNLRVFELRGDISLDGAERISRRLVNDGRIVQAVLDMHRVTSLAAPAARLLVECIGHLGSRGGGLCFSRLGGEPGVEAALREALAPGVPWVSFADNDRAIEWCENHLLGSLPRESAEAGLPALADFELLRGLDADSLAAVAPLLEESSHPAGTSIVQAGAADDDRIFLLLQGEVSVLVDTASGQNQRLATLGAGMSFGEMVMLGQTTRSATVHADTEVRCWVLRARALDELATRVPALKITLLANLAASLAAKLGQANRLVAALAG